MEPVVIVVIVTVALALVVGVTAFLLRGRDADADTLLEPPPARTPLRGSPSGAGPEADTSDDLQSGDVDMPASEVEALEVEVLEVLDVEVLDDAGNVVAEVTEVEVAPVEERVRPSFRDRLSKARGTISGYLGSVRSRSGIDAETWDELEEALIRADVGVATTQGLLGRVRGRVEAESITDPEVLLDALKDEVRLTLTADRELRYAAEAPSVWLFVGVNGVGKTTTIGKVGRREADAGRSIVMAAGDTFRAAAAEQLATWAERAGAHLVRGEEGGDPAAIVFDSVSAAQSRGADLVLADTAGRLHTKSNLMEELRKVRRVADKGSGTVTEVLLVIDATTGQNGLVQAQQFTEATDVTGVVLTKLDGSAKGGIVLAIQADLGIPVKLVGLGEGADDLVAFDVDEYVDALFN